MFNVRVRAPTCTSCYSARPSCISLSRRDAMANGDAQIITDLFHSRCTCGNMCKTRSLSGSPRRVRHFVASLARTVSRSPVRLSLSDSVVIRPFPRAPSSAPRVRVARRVRRASFSSTGVATRRAARAMARALYMYRSRARLSLDRDRLSAARRARTYTRTKRSTFLGGCDETRQTHTRTSHHAHHAGDEPRESGCAVIGG